MPDVSESGWWVWPRCVRYLALLACLSLASFPAAAANILLVDDGGQDDILSYEAALTDYGETYTLYDTGISGDPDDVTLAAYDTVIWSGPGPANHSGEDDLQDYLATTPGSCLIKVDDQLSARSSFLDAVLGINKGGRYDTTLASMTGTNAASVMGNFPMDFVAAGLTNHAKGVTLTTGVAIFEANSGADILGVQLDATDWRTMTLTTPFAAIAGAIGRVRFLGAALGYCATGIWTPPPSDVDNDGVDDSVDNCPDDYNPSQYDDDSDGSGNACDQPSILLVNDDEGNPDESALYSAALDDAGFDGYTLHDATQGVNSDPDLSTLSAHEIIIWFTGDDTSSSVGPDTTTENNINQALQQQGGCLVMLSRDYTSVAGNSFRQNTLGIQGGGNRVNIFSMDGVGPASSLGFYELIQPSGVNDNARILTPYGNGVTTFEDGGLSVGIQSEGGGWRSFTLTVPFSALNDSTVRAGLMSSIVGYCETGIWSPPDPDEDDVTGPQDNCPQTFNPDQNDTDTDGRGDVCDASILLVDDDEETPDVRSYYTNALKDAGRGDYTVYDASALPDPDIVTLATYDVVVWFTGDDAINGLVGPDSTAQTNLASALNGSSSCLAMLSRDFASAGVQTSFRQNVLGISNFGSVNPVSTLEGTGAASAIGPYSISIPATFSSQFGRSLIADVSATGVYTGDGGPDIYGIEKQDPAWRAFTLSLPFSGIGEREERAEFMSTVLNYCTTGAWAVPDYDGDGIANAADNCTYIANTNQLDFDSNGHGDVCDLDDDNDGVPDTHDAFSLDNFEWSDTDSDGIGNNADTDDDNDGIDDNVDPDDDNDGVPDVSDAFPADPNESVDTDADSIGDNGDNCPLLSNLDQKDIDGDGYGNVCDAFPVNPSEWIDTDSDGVGDNSDAFPNDPAEWADTDSDGIGNNADTDDDNDGVPDTSDAFPLDPGESVDTDGDGTGDNADTDDDNDGVPDTTDAFPLDPTETVDTDSDGVGDNGDNCPTTGNPGQENADGDAFGDACDAFPNDATEWVDTDGDGVGDNSDEFPSDPTESRDTDGDGIGNNADPDIDNDGIDNAADPDMDGDGYSNYFEGVKGSDAGNDISVPSFTADVLLVDDDQDSPDTRAIYTNALTQIGVSYDTFDVSTAGHEPFALTLTEYQSVVWYSGDVTTGAGPEVTSEPALTAYLDGGGCLFLSSQGYLNDKTVDAFITGYLGVSSVITDTQKSLVIAADNGVPGNWSYQLEFPVGISNNTDTLTLATGALQTFEYDAPGGAVAGVDYDNGTHKSMFWAFPLEALPDAYSQARMLRHATGYCGVAAHVNDPVTRYQFKAMYPTLEQPWYFGGSGDIELSPAGNVVAHYSRVFIREDDNGTETVVLTDMNEYTKQGAQISAYVDIQTGKIGPVSLDGIDEVAVGADGRIYLTTLFITNPQSLKVFSSDLDLIGELASTSIGDLVAGPANAVYARTGTTIQKYVEVGGSIQIDSGWAASGTLLVASGSSYAVDTSDNLYVLDPAGNVTRFDSDGTTVITSWTAHAGTESAIIRMGQDGNVHVLRDGGALDVFTTLGASVNSITLPETGLPDFIVRNDGVYVVAADAAINTYSGDGDLIDNWTATSDTGSLLKYPIDVAVDGSNNIFVLDSCDPVADNCRVRKYNSSFSHIVDWSVPYGSRKIDAFNGFVYVSQAGNSINSYEYPAADGYDLHMYTDAGTFLATINPGDSVFSQSAGTVMIPATPHYTYGENGLVYVSDALPDSSLSSGVVQVYLPTINYPKALLHLEDLTFSDQGSNLSAPILLHASAFSDYIVGEVGGALPAAFIPATYKFDASGQLVWKSPFAFDVDTGDPDGPQYLDSADWTVDGDGYGYSLGYQALVAKVGTGFIDKYDPSISPVASIIGLGRRPGDADNYDEGGFGLDSAGNIWIADTNNHRIQVLRKRLDEPQTKAIVIAGGGPFPGNNLWSATKAVADYSYNALKLQGFNNDSIYYLSADTRSTVVDGDATWQGIKDALTGWALADDNSDGQVDARDVVIFFQDHGGEDTFLVNSQEIMTRSDLEGWLSTLETGIQGDTTIIYDACRSGSFSPLTGAGRTVITSAGANESAYFTGNGLMSFSRFFWAAIINGDDVGDAFTAAVGGLDGAPSGLGQTPLLNGNSLPNAQTDITNLQGVFIGSGNQNYLVGPVFQTTSAASTGASTGTITATGVSDPDGVKRVWAVLYPPDFVSGDSENPVTDLPTVDLVKSQTTAGTYEAEYSGFTVAGTYTIVIHATDGQGRTSLQQTTSLTIGSPLSRRAIIVTDNDPAWWQAADAVYRALLSQGYKAAEIQYRSAAGLSGVDGSPTLTTLQSDLSTWAPVETQDLTLYLIGTSDGSDFPLNDTETVSAATLDGWLNTLITAIPGKLTVIMDADNAGFYLERLDLTAATTLVNNDFYRLASTIGGRAHFEGNGSVSYTQFFAGNVSNGATVPVAHLLAKQAMRAVSNGQQQAWLDSNSDNTSDKFDISRILNYSLGPGILLAGDDPVIGSAGVEGFAAGADPMAVTLWADDITTTGTLDEVWALVTPPDTDGFGGNDPVPVTVPLTDSGTRFESNYNLPSPLGGTYTVSFYASDTDGAVSLPWIETLTREDAYEPDNDETEISPLFVDAPAQYHSFHVTTDEDWVTFTADDGKTYTITADPVGEAADVVLFVRDPNGATTTIDDLPAGAHPLGAESYIVAVDSSNDGIFEVKVSLDNTVSPPNEPSDYTLAVTTDGGGSGTTSVAGQVKDPGGNGVELAFVKVTGTGGTSGTSSTLSVTPNGDYSIGDGPGSYTLTATKTGYQPADAGTITIPEQGTTIRNITMTSDGSGDTDGDGIPDASDPYPYNVDGDDDGLCDGPNTVAGVCVAGEDLDADGVVDSGETDPTLVDSDGDTFNDGMEVLYGSDPLNISDTPENNHVNNGDVNGDGGVDAADVLLATRIVLNQYTPTDAEQVRADMVPDGMITAGDLVRIHGAALGM